MNNLERLGLISFKNKFECGIKRCWVLGVPPSNLPNAWSLSVNEDKKLFVDIEKARKTGVNPVSFMLEGIHIHSQIVIGTFGRFNDTNRYATYMINGYPYNLLEKRFCQKEHFFSQVFYSAFAGQYKNRDHYESYLPGSSNIFDLGILLLAAHIDPSYAVNVRNLSWLEK